MKALIRIKNKAINNGGIRSITHLVSLNFTNYEIERMFSMNNNNNANYNNKNGRGTENSNGQTKCRYAAVAAAFAILIGGIGGSVALGKHMEKNSKPGTAFAENITVASGSTTSMTSFVETTVTEEGTTATPDNRHKPSDLEAFAQEWLDNYNEWLKIPNGVFEHDEKSVSFRMAEGSEVANVDAWKITDEEYCSADAINKHLHAFWAPESKEDITPIDLTEKINNGTASYSDFLGSIYFTYNNELYSRICNSHIEGRRTSPSAEMLNNNEIFVHFDLGCEGVTEQQTMHLVWIDELNDWRVDDIYFEN